MEGDVLGRLETRQPNSDKQQPNDKEGDDLVVHRKTSLQSMTSIDIDCSCVHWGFLNICQLTSNGKKIKSAIWRTLWVDLCGSNLRLYKDKSLAVGVNDILPPSSIVPPVQQGLQKVAFFGLKHAKVSICHESDVISLKSKRLRNAYSRVHTFEIHFTKINSSYVCQAPSNSSLLRWVSKIQEGVSESQSNQRIGNVDERLRLAKLIVAKQQERLVDRLQEDDALSGEENEEIDDDVNEELLAGQVQLTDAEKDKLVALRRTLQEKNDLLWQLQEQETSFLGGVCDEGVRGDEFVGTLTQDHLVVPGRPSTLLPAGSRLHLFGQLPNRRWRCAAMNSDGRELLDDCNVPVVGSVPSSVIHELSTKALAMEVGDVRQSNNVVRSRPSSSASSSSELSSESEEDETQETSYSNILQSPYSTHREKTKSTSRRKHLNNESQSSATDRKETPTSMRANANDIMIKRRLRQVGISIVLKSSSSEGEAAALLNDVKS